VVSEKNIPCLSNMRCLCYPFGIKLVLHWIGSAGSRRDAYSKGLALLRVISSVLEQCRATVRSCVASVHQSTVYFWQESKVHSGRKPLSWTRYSNTADSELLEHCFFNISIVYCIYGFIQAYLYLTSSCYFYWDSDVVGTINILIRVFYILYILCKDECLT
jgi:hypothetical protein